MLTNLRGSLLVLCSLGALSAAVIACSGGTTSPGSSGAGTSGSVITPEPQQQAQITAPSGMKVSASIAAASLGEECGSSGIQAPSQGDCAVGGCTSYCQQSNVQIAFNAGAGSKAAAIQIIKVELVDSVSGNVVDTLTASKPQVWNGSTYSAWDQNVTPGGDLKASYDLTAPKWSTIDSTAAAGGTTKDGRGTSSWSKAYKLHVTLSIDGVEIILESTDLNRQPVAVT